MSYIGDPFTHDLFVSYSQGAKIDAGDLKNWSLALIRRVLTELRYQSKYTNALSVFMDALDGPGREGLHVPPFARLTDELKWHVERSAILLVLMSPQYLREAGDWCKNERQWWWNTPIAAPTPREDRVAIVEIWPEASLEDSWPAEFRDSAGKRRFAHPFFEGLGEFRRPIGWADDITSLGSTFKREALDLAAKISSRLDTLKGAKERADKAFEEIRRLASRSEKKTLYVYGRSNEIDSWKRICDEIDGIGSDRYIVVPTEPDSVETPIVESKKSRDDRVKALAGSDALILVGGHNGLAIEADLLVIGKHDRESARSMSGTLLPCAVFNTSGESVATARRKQLARNLRSDWYDVAPGQAATCVQKWLEGVAQSVLAS